MNGMIAGYLAGVVVALLAFTIAICIRIGATPSADVDGALFSVEFVVLIILHWLVASAPFTAVRKFGGFDNVWFSTFVGGVLTAFLMLPLQVWLYVTLMNIEGNLSYFPTLGNVADANWPIIIMSGALGGLTYAGVKHVCDRSTSASDGDAGGEAGSRRPV